MGKKAVSSLLLSYKSFIGNWRISPARAICGNVLSARRRSLPATIDRYFVLRRPVSGKVGAPRDIKCVNFGIVNKQRMSRSRRQHQPRQKREGENETATKKTRQHLHEVSWQTNSGGWSRYYYAVFRCRLKKKNRRISLGCDLRVAKDQLAKIEAKNIDRYDFDIDKQRIQEKPRDGKATPFTFAEWADKYPALDDVKRKRSLCTDLILIRVHLKPFFGSCSPTEIERESLTRYVDRRSEQTLVRGAKGQSKKLVSRGTISNELSLLRRMLRTALREGYKAVCPSFEGLIIRTDRGGREIGEDEQQKVLPLFKPWMRRLWNFARETCLAQADLLRLTFDMIDERQGTITLAGGRKKSGVEQVSPLTHKAREILEQIKDEKKTGAIVRTCRTSFLPERRDADHARSDSQPSQKGDQRDGGQEVCLS
jgi:hypothetical protein